MINKVYKVYFEVYEKKHYHIGGIVIDKKEFYFSSKQAAEDYIKDIKEASFILRIDIFPYMQEIILQDSTLEPDEKDEKPTDAAN